jgi:hypothetical protein
MPIPHKPELPIPFALVSFTYWAFTLSWIFFSSFVPASKIFNRHEIRQFGFGFTSIFGFIIISLIFYPCLVIALSSLHMLIFLSLSLSLIFVFSSPPFVVHRLVLLYLFYFVRNCVLVSSSGLLRRHLWRRQREFFFHKLHLNCCFVFYLVSVFLIALRQ